MPTSIAPRRTHPLTPLLTAASLAWRGALPLAILLISDGGPRSIVLPLLLAGVAVLLVATTLVWRKHTYAVNDGALVVEWGLLNRQRREVPLARIQQVDVRRSFLQRVFGLSALHVDTASAGTGAEVVLASLSEPEAAALHRLVLSQGRGVGVAAGAIPADPGVPGAPGPGLPSPWTEPPRRVLRLGVADLVLAAVTGPALAIGIGLLAAFGGPIIEDVAGSADSGSTVRSLLVVSVFAGAALVFVVGTAVVRTVLAQNDFTVERIGSDLRVHRGLLEQRETTVALHRIQCIRVHENPLRRALGRCSVALQSGGRGGSSGSGEQSGIESTDVTIPLLPRAALPALLAEVAPSIGALPTIDPAPQVALRRRRTRAAVPTALAAAIAVAAIVLGAHPAVLAVPLAVGVVGFWSASASYRALGSGLGDDVVVARSGAWTRETVIVPMARLQSVTLRTSPLQARVGIATLQLDVAGRGASAEIVDQVRPRLVDIRAAALFDDSTRADERRARERTRRAARAERADVAG